MKSGHKVSVRFDGVDFAELAGPCFCLIQFTPLRRGVRLEDLRGLPVNPAVLTRALTALLNAGIVSVEGDTYKLVKMPQITFG